MNNNNKKTSVTTIVIISIAVLLLGYFLFKSSPQNASTQNASTQTSGSNGNMDGMHGGGNAATNSATLNALVGKPMPGIKLADKDGKIYTADSFKGKNTVLFFSEGLMCYPACWNQIAAFGSDQRFNTDKVQAISVVVDPASDWQKAIAKMPDLAKASTLFDAAGSASRQLGLLNLPSSMHKGSLPGHTYIVIDKDGIVRYVNDDPNMAVANDALMAKIAELK